MGKKKALRFRFKARPGFLGYEGVIEAYNSDMRYLYCIRSGIKRIIKSDAIDDAKNLLKE